MAGGEFVLAHKEEKSTFIKLTFTRKNRPQWEATEEIHLATLFHTPHEAEERQRAHSVPPAVYKPKPYENAHHEWAQRQSLDTFDATDQTPFL